MPTVGICCVCDACGSLRDGKPSPGWTLGGSGLIGPPSQDRKEQNLMRAWVGTIYLISSGWKNGSPPKADLIIDCRGIPNPFHAPSLAGMTGDTIKVQDWVLDKGKNQLDGIYTQIVKSHDQIVNQRIG